MVIKLENMFIYFNQIAKISQKIHIHSYSFYNNININHSNRAANQPASHTILDSVYSV